MARHCPECGFVNAEGANYCPRCGAFLGTPRAARRASRRRPTSSTSRPASCGRSTSSDVAAGGGALVIRSGGGRVGQSFPLRGERVTIGRSPEADVFLDDVTVSRDHAVLVHRQGGWYLDDSGSLNGTYVNRKRIDSHRLEDGDELQIGKYKLTYLAR